jgi:hypothetical protein
MSERETFQTGLRLKGRRPSVRCRACDAVAAHLSRGLCTECREETADRPYGTHNGHCLDCGEPVNEHGRGCHRDCGMVN